MTQPSNWLSQSKETNILNLSGLCDPFCVQSEKQLKGHQGMKVSSNYTTSHLTHSLQAEV